MAETDQQPEYPPWWRHPRTPLAQATGRPVDEVAQIYRDEGFIVEVRDLDGSTRDDLSLSDNRIRLWIRNGIVERAAQG